MFVRNLIRRLHRTKTPTLFLKLDIVKDFDIVQWDCLLEQLQKRGLPNRWTNQISIILSTESSRVLLNGIPGTRINHGRGLWQGDPLSPFLFILKSTPSEHDVSTTRQLLHNFGNSRLQTNFEKSTVVPISRDNTNLDVVLLHFPVIISTFPIKYKGLPLDFKRLQKVHFHPLLDKVATRLVGWQGGLLTPSGRTTLVKSVLTSIPTYYITFLKTPKASFVPLTALDVASYIWARTDAISGVMQS